MNNTVLRMLREFWQTAISSWIVEWINDTFVRLAKEKKRR